VNRYEISYSETERIEGKIRSRRVVVSESAEGVNGIEAIKSFLRGRFQGERDLLDALETEARTVGSIKRLTLGGITFQADKIG
jgi:cytoskeletal protein CcmA (bactofilin family)